MSFGTALRDIRTRRGWSQEKLATRIGVTKATISAWEGDHKLPESSRLPVIREVLGTSLDDLFPPPGGGSGCLREEQGVYGRSEVDLLFDQLTPAQRAAVLGLIDAFSGK